MNHQAKERLQVAARRFLAARPWDHVGDDYLFGLHDREAGRFGCASVMGAAGLEFGLSVNLGAAGFELLRRLQEEEIDHSTLLAQSSGISFVLGQHVEGDHPYRVGDAVIPREDGVPGVLSAWRLVPGQPPRALDSEEAQFLSRCLEAVADLALKNKLGKVSARDGSRVLFYNLSELKSGKVKTRQSYRRLDEVPVGHEPFRLSADLLARLRARERHSGRYQLSLFVPPVSVAGGLAWTALLHEPETDTIAFLHTEHSFQAAAASVFEAIAAGRCAANAPPLALPREVWTDSFPVYEALKETLAELEVRFVCKTSGLPALEALRTSLSDFLVRQ